MSGYKVVRVDGDSEHVLFSGGEFVQATDAAEAAQNERAPGAYYVRAPGYSQWIKTVPGWDREGATLLAKIATGFQVEWRAHWSGVCDDMHDDRYLVIVTWQANAGGKDWRPVQYYDLSPTMQRSLMAMLAASPSPEEVRS